MPSIPETVAIRNPRVREVIGEEMDFGAGRNATEAAENLILAGAEHRKLSRARGKGKSKSSGTRRPKAESAVVA